jgi:glutamyl-tRNA(Gln) amidotransferase subunit E
MEEVNALRKAVGAGEEDAVVFVADTAENVLDALRAVVERAQEALELVPAETRTAKEDGTTRYMRPRPGAARMYPETDIPPSLITEEFVERVRANLPEPAEKKQFRFLKDYHLNEKLAKQVIDSEYSALFEIVVKESGIAATTIAAFLTETLKALKREGVQVENVTDTQLRTLFQAVRSGKLTKEALPDVFTWFAKTDEGSLPHALKSLGLEMMSKVELKQLIDRIVAANTQSVEQQDAKAFRMLMGLVMKEARGRADPSVVSKLLRKRLS